MPSPDSFIQVNNTTVPGGKKLATYEFFEGPDLVESEAVTLTDSVGNEVLPATEATATAIAGSAASIDAKIRPPAGNATVTPIAAANVPTPFLVADPARIGFSVFNQSQTDTLYLLLTTAGGPVSPTLFSVLLQPNAYYEDVFGYTGPVSGIWGSVNPGSQALVNNYTV